MDEDNEALVSLLQSANTSSAHGMDTEVMDFLPSESEHGHVGPIYGPHLPGLEAGNSVENVPSNSPVPHSFMASYDEPTPGINADIKDASVQPGQSGLQNMGNTCFMNSGLQCLMHNSYLCHSLLGNCSFPPETLTGRFVELLTKVWEGQYAVLHPLDFKEKLGSVHGQFKDYRQHDGQEFLALLLDSLHQELNWNARQGKVVSPATDLSEESDDSHYASEASSSKLSELEALELDSMKDEPINNRNPNAQCSDREPPASAADSLQGSTAERSKDPVRLPSIEEFYMKDVKTLNTNMLQENEISLPLATGSDKFPKKKLSKAERLSLRGRTENSFQKSPVKNKKTNVIAARKSRAHGCSLNSKSRDAAVNTLECSSSTDEQESTKRMKMDSVEADAIFDKPSNVVSANFHDYIVRGSGDDSVAYDREADQLGLETLSRRLKQELDSETQGCDSSAANFSETFLTKKNEDLISKLEHMPSSTTSANNMKRACLLKEDAANMTEEGQPQREFIPNNKEHLSSLELEKPSTSFEKNQEGEKQWDDYLRNNESVIVDNFHGQLKSTVICKVCGHVSIIYEPFMYLSVPLPRAMEKQFVITFVGSRGQTPIRYAVVLNKTDTVTELRRTLLYTLYGEISGREIVLAEGLDCHISRILEDGLQLQYVNSGFRLIYAFEIDYKPCVTMAMTSDLSDGTSLSVNLSQASAYEATDSCTISSSSDFATLGPSQYAGSGFDCSNEWDMLGSEVTTSSEEKPKFTRENSKEQESIAAAVEPDSTVSIGQQHQTNGDDSVFSNVPTFRMDSQEHVDSSQERPTPIASNDSTQDASSGWQEQSEAEESHVGDSEAAAPTTQETDKASSAGPVGSVVPRCDGDNNDDVKTEVGDHGEVSDIRDELNANWHVCVICLEEMPIDQLLMHAICQGKLCHQCVSRTKKHYGEETISCPVCRADMNPITDFVPMMPAVSSLPLLRVLLLPVQFRNDWVENGERKMTQFGHPNVLYILNKVSGEDLFSQLETIAPVTAEFAVALTDSQGMRCSRCSYDLHCSGCHLAREVDITLSPDDHLTVCFYDLTLEAMEEATRSVDHETMDHLESNDPITLQDCFRAFTASEELDDCNPWFCPECKQHQQAMKTIAIQKFPNTLIVYLKRFVFHQFTSTKLDNKVIFPIEDLSFSEFMGPDCSLVYDLQSAVCHFGGVNAGHYTCYVKNPITGSWQYCNDETIEERQPSLEDAENVYILFYQRKVCPDVTQQKYIKLPLVGLIRDTVLPFKLPRPIKPAESLQSLCKEVEQSPSPMDDQSHYSNSDDINKLLASLNREDGPSKAVGAEAVLVDDSLEVQMDGTLEARLRELD